MTDKKTCIMFKIVLYYQTSKLKGIKMIYDETIKASKEVQRASFRFEKSTFEEFRAICKEHGFSQTKLLERLMRDFNTEMKDKEDMRNEK